MRVIPFAVSALLLVAAAGPALGADDIVIGAVYPLTGSSA